jgi:hypothetical protein
MRINTAMIRIRHIAASAILIIVAGLVMNACSIIRAPATPGLPTGTLQGVVTGPSGPIANAEVSVTAADATQHTGVSNGNGFYSISSIPAGPATYTVQASGYAQVDGAVTIAADPNTNRQDVSLNPQ